MLRVIYDDITCYSRCSDPLMTEDEGLGLVLGSNPQIPDGEIKAFTNTIIERLGCIMRCAILASKLI